MERTTPMLQIQEKNYNEDPSQGENTGEHLPDTLELCIRWLEVVEHTDWLVSNQLYVLVKHAVCKDVHGKQLVCEQLYESCLETFKEQLISVLESAVRQLWISQLVKSCMTAVDQLVCKLLFRNSC